MNKVKASAECKSDKLGREWIVGEGTSLVGELRVRISNLAHPSWKELRFRFQSLCRLRYTRTNQCPLGSKRQQLHQGLVAKETTHGSIQSYLDAQGAASTENEYRCECTANFKAHQQPKKNMKDGLDET